MTGKIDVDSPVAIEMCTGPVAWRQGLGDAEFIGDTPCQYNVAHFRGRTDAEGRFTFSNVPPYDMTLVVRRSAKEWAIRGPACCDDLKPDELRDIGSFDP